MGAPGRPGTQEVGSEYPFITCPCSPHRKPETVSTMHLFMGDRWGGQESSHPRKQVHARSLRGFLGSPCFLPPWKMPSMDLYLLWPFFQSTGRKKWGCWARGGGVSCLSQGSKGSHRHSGVSAPATSGRFAHGQGLSAQGPPSTAHSQRRSIATRHGLEGQSAKGRLSPGELKLWKDRHTLKGPCSWQLTAVSTSGPAGEG